MAKTKIINPNADILSDGEKEFITENRTQTVSENKGTTLETSNKTRTPVSYTHLTLPTSDLV